MRFFLFFNVTLLLFIGCGTGPTPVDIDDPREADPEIEGVLAVNYFADLREAGDELDWLSRSITDFFIAELTKLDFISVTSRSIVREVLEEQEFALLSGLTEETTQLGRILEADYILSGDYHLQDARLSITARLINVETSEIVRAFHVTGHESSLRMLQERLLYEFLGFVGVPLRADQLAARDYDADTESIRRFYRAERLAEQEKHEEARQELELLLAENHLFTPAREELEGFESKDAGMLIDGRSAVEAADEELRQELYYRNLSRSFAQYAAANAFEMEVTAVDVDSRDAQSFWVTVEGRAIIRREFRETLDEFRAVHPYITPESDSSYERFIRQGGSDPDLHAPELFFLQFSRPMLSPEENYYGFIRLRFLDAVGNEIHRVDSREIRDAFVHVANYTGAGAMRSRHSVAAIGGDLRAPFRSGIWLAQARFELVQELSRGDMQAVAEITAEPVFRAGD